MANILALSFFPAHLPPRSGGEVRLFGLYEALSASHRIALITSGHPHVEDVRLEHNAAFTEVRVAKEDEFLRQWQDLSEHAGSGDLSAVAIAASSGKFSRIHEEYLKAYAAADIIIHDSPFLAGYDLFLGFDAKPRIYNSYNVETDLYRQFHGGSDRRHIQAIVGECEARLCRYADVITACSEDDRARFHELFEIRGKTALVPNGVSFRPEPARKPSRKDVVFIGSSHLPNRIAAQAIAEEIAPANPSFMFHILGSCMEPGTLGPNCIAHGMVDDATKAERLTSALAAINPMTEGGGSSLKVLDFAAARVPLVSTDMGARGFEMEAGCHYLPLNPDDFGTSAGLALADVALLDQVGSAASDHVNRHFTWQRVAGRMSALVGEAIESKTAGDRPRFLVLNDYDPFRSVGGGCTRIRGLYEAVAETAHIFIICFSGDGELSVREELDGRALVIAIPKTATQQAAEQADAALHHVSTADILAIDFARENSTLRRVYSVAAEICDLVVCEHPYLVYLPFESGHRFVYSSQNVETTLKQGLLQGHPRISSLLQAVASAERIAVGSSELVVAVSDQDAAQFSTFPLVAPLVVIPNGADEALEPSLRAAEWEGFNVCFVGSAHMPNVEAVQFIVDVLAPRLPEVRFHIAGSVCGGVTKVPASVKLWGLVDNPTKSDLLAHCQLAANPMSSGGGSNVKVADYLKNGLRVLTTAFGARGYESVDPGDLIVAPVEEFADVIAALATDFAEDDRIDRRQRYKGRLSMVAYGHDFARHLHDALPARPRVLFVTYRYNEPMRGGAEIYVGKLLDALVDAGMAVDVIAPEVVEIRDHGRFECDFPCPAGRGATPVGRPHIRTAKFPLTESDQGSAKAAALWMSQPDFERERYLQFRSVVRRPVLAWGWAGFDGGGRWTYSSFGLDLPETSAVTLKGRSPAKRLLRVESGDGKLLAEAEVAGNFELAIQAPAGVVAASLFLIEADRPADIRPLGVYLAAVTVHGQQLVEEALAEPWLERPAVEIYRGFHAAAKVSRAGRGLSLADARGPHSLLMEEFLAENCSAYDLVITHNPIFRPAISALKAARRAAVPSICLPHPHFDDDFYHFPDFLEACRDADTTLVCPHAAVEFLEGEGVAQVAYHAPGIDTDEPFGEQEAAAFAQLCPAPGEYFIVLGRKASAKNYRQITDSVGAIRAMGRDVRLVLVGPDDDGLPVTEDYVSYLGMIDRTALRGALAGALALVNMSSSESFGMVLLEAGLAGIPVVANHACAAFHDIVTDGATGFLVDRSGLDRALLQLLDDRDLRERLGSGGRSAALAHGWSAVSEDFVRHCETLIGRGRPRA